MPCLVANSLFHPTCADKGKHIDVLFACLRFSEHFCYICRTIARTKTIINEEGKLMEVKEQVVEPITESWEGGKALTDRQIQISSYVAYFLFLICGVRTNSSWLSEYIGTISLTVFKHCTLKIGYQIQFSAVTSAIVYFKDLYGPSIFRIIVGGMLLPLSLFLLLLSLSLSLMGF